ncbi:MAG: hypothetical protein ACI9UA_006297 [Pseudoalteromonas tetraodonis]|jgi:hypothetical protein
MTGFHPVKSGIYKNLFSAHEPRWWNQSPVLKNAIVLSQQFRDNGYRAVGGGKIFHTLQWTCGDSQNDQSTSVRLPQRLHSSIQNKKSPPSPAKNREKWTA